MLRIKMRIRYCALRSCPRNRGCTDMNIQYFRSPTDENLLAKWKAAANIDHNAQFYLCFMHFREDDILKDVRMILKSGAIPIAETLDESFIQDSIQMETDSIDRPLEESMCESCINYAVELEAAQAEIVKLKERVNELLEGEWTMMNQTPQESLQLRRGSTPIEDIEQETEPELLHIPFDPDNLISFDDAPLNDSSISYGTEYLDEMDDKNSCGDKSSASTERAPLDRVELSQASDEILPSSPKEKNVSRANEIWHLEEILPSSPKGKNISQANEVWSLDEISPSLPKEKNVSQANEVWSSNKILPSSSKENVVMKLFKCAACSEMFDSISDLSSHVRAKKCYTCKICEVKLPSAEIDTHLCSGVESIRCDYCSGDFASTSKLVDHLEKWHATNVKLHQCEKCTKRIPSFALMRFHMNIHAPEPFACKICTKTFATEFHLKCHYETHNQDKQYLCEECGKGFSSKRNVELHRLTHDFDRKPTLQCPECPEKFLNVQLLKEHAQTHLEQDYVCSICRAIFKSIEGYQDHMKIHRRTETDRKYACKLCPRKFSNSDDLRNHQKVHTGVKAFRCRFCPQSYKYSVDLNKHLRTHFGNKLHECSKCPKRFKYARQLEEHQSQHYRVEKWANESMKENFQHLSAVPSASLE